jgi:uncharacterized membrane protein
MEARARSMSVTPPPAPLAPQGPPGPSGSLAPLALAAVGLAAYAVASHWLMVNAADRPWAVAALFGPLLLAVAAGGLRRRHAPTLLFFAATVVVLVVVVARGGVEDVQLMYVLQHAGIHAALGWTFAATLRPGGTALITQLASRIHTRFTPAMRAYTTGLTRVWAGYFFAMIALSFGLYLSAPWPWWSFFCNILTPVFAVAFFAGEHGLRYRLHPEFERVSMRGAWQAWRGLKPGAE